MMARAHVNSAHSAHIQAVQSQIDNAALNSGRYVAAHDHIVAWYHPNAAYNTAPVVIARMPIAYNQAGEQATESESGSVYIDATGALKGISMHTTVNAVVGMMIPEGKRKLGHDLLLFPRTCVVGAAPLTLQNISENVNNALKDDRHCKHKFDAEQLTRIQVDTLGLTFQEFTLNSETAPMLGCSVPSEVSETMMLVAPATKSEPEKMAVSAFRALFDDSSVLGQQIVDYELVSTRRQRGAATRSSPSNTECLQQWKSIASESDVARLYAQMQQIVVGQQSKRRILEECGPNLISSTRQLYDIKEGELGRGNPKSECMTALENALYAAEQVLNKPLTQADTKTCLELDKALNQVSTDCHKLADSNPLKASMSELLGSVARTNLGPHMNPEIPVVISGAKLPCYLVHRLQQHLQPYFLPQLGYLALSWDAAIEPKGELKAKGTGYLTSAVYNQMDAVYNKEVVPHHHRLIISQAQARHLSHLSCSNALTLTTHSSIVKAELGVPAVSTTQQPSISPTHSPSTCNGASTNNLSMQQMVQEADQRLRDMQYKTGCIVVEITRDSLDKCRGRDGHIDMDAVRNKAFNDFTTSFASYQKQVDENTLSPEEFDAARIRILGEMVYNKATGGTKRKRLEHSDSIDSGV